MKEGPEITKNNQDELEYLRKRIAELELSETALKQSNKVFEQTLKFLDSVLESLPYPFHVIDAFDYTISIANSATDFSRLSKNSTCYALTHKVDSPCGSATHTCPVEEIKKTKKQLTVEHTHYDKDGNPKVVEVSAYPVFDSTNNVSQIIECPVDITDRKQAEEALKESKKHYQSLFDSSMNPTNLIDRNGIFLMINQASARQLGGSPVDFIGKSIYEVLPENAEKLMEKHQEIFESGVETEFEVLVDLTSDKRWFLSTLHPIRDAKGEIFAVQVIAYDITERKQVEEALKESKERYQSLFDSSMNPTNLIDQNGIFIMINQAAARQLGGSPVDFIGKSIYELLPENAKELMEKHQQVFESGQGEEFEVFIELPSGKRWFLSTLHPIRDAKGNIFAVQVISYDITDRKQSEEALKESAEKIKLFAYSVSHDIKNPAIGIYGVTKLLHKKYMDILDEKGKNYCDQILKASEQLAALVEQINVYISTKESPLIIECVNLKQLVEMVRDEFASQINIRQISWSQPESMAEINVDRLSILRVLRNFVDNALKYGGDELTEIEISCEESDNFHLLSVKDNGIGIAEEDSKRIFGLFERNVTSRGIEGTGLGLAIAKEIAGQHKGKVWAEPGREKGTIFYISISKDLKPSYLLT